MKMTAGEKNSHKNRHEKRRSNKPLMEKRRRARINQSLSILKSIILQDSASLDQRPNCKGNAAQSRLEKADILELTVTHLRYLEKQRQERQLSDETEHDKESYRIGYESCLRDIRHYLQNASADQLVAKRDLLLYLEVKRTDQPAAHSSNAVDSKGDDPSRDVNVTPTRLPDGRLALIFSSAWLSVQNSNSVRNDDVTPPCSPSDSAPLAAASPVNRTNDGQVWRPW